MTDCGICLEQKNDSNIKYLPCKHFLCNDCYNQIIVSECPYCRKPYANSYIIQQQKNELSGENEISLNFNDIFHILHCTNTDTQTMWKIIAM